MAHCSLASSCLSIPASSRCCEQFINTASSAHQAVTAVIFTIVSRIFNQCECPCQVLADVGTFATVQTKGDAKDPRGFGRLSLLHQNHAKVVPCGREPFVFECCAAQVAFSLSQPPEFEVGRPDRREHICRQTLFARSTVVGPQGKVIFGGRHQPVPDHKPVNIVCRICRRIRPRATAQRRQPRVGLRAADKRKANNKGSRNSHKPERA
jgi:hypothetical protein